MQPQPPAADARSATALPPASHTRRLSLAVLAVAAVLVAVFIVWTTKGLAFYLDDWSFIVTRRHGPIDLVDPYNDHWQAFPILIYQVGLALRGLFAYPWLVLAAAACHSAAAICLFLALHRVRPWLALVAALALLAFTWSDEVFILPVNTSYTLPVAFGMLALACWDRDGAPNRASDAAGVIAMIAAFASGGVAIPIAIVVTGIVVGARRGPAALVPVLIPWLAFAGWFLLFGRSSNALEQAARLDPTLLPAFVATGLATLAAPLLALDHRYQGFGLMVVTAVVALGLGRLRSGSVRIWLPLAGVGLVYVIVGLARLAAFGVDGALAPRYVFPALALLLLGVAPLVDGLIDVAGPRGQRALAIVVAAWFVAMLVGDVDKFRRAIPVYEARSDVIDTELGAMQRLRPTIEALPMKEEIFDRHLLGRMTPAEYYAALDALPHPPAPSADALGRRAPGSRRAADVILDRLLRPGLQPGKPPGALPRGTDAAEPFGLLHDTRLTSTNGACRTFEVLGSDPWLELLGVRGRGVTVRTDGQRTLQVFTRILAPTFGGTVHSILPEPGRWYDVILPPLSGGLDWSLRLDPPPGSHQFDICLGAAAPAP